MKEELFRGWLAPHLGEDSIRSYLSNARRVERAIGRSLDVCDLTEAGLSDIRRALIGAGVPTRKVGDCLSALRRYRAFLEAGGSGRGAVGSASSTAPGGRSARARRLTPVETALTGDRVLAEATGELGIDLVALIARCAIWAHPSVVAALMRDDPAAAWLPNCRRRRLGEVRNVVVDGVLLDDNTRANGAIKLATFGHRRLTGFHACHVWPDSCYDARHHTSIANLVLLPAPLAGLTDYDKAVAAALQYRAFELYGWRPQDQPIPERPVGYPAPQIWRAPQPVTAQVQARLDHRLARTAGWSTAAA